MTSTGGPHNVFQGLLCLYLIDPLIPPPQADTLPLWV